MPLYYEGVGRKRQQVWGSRLSYTATKSRKAKIELEQTSSEQHSHPQKKKDMIVSEFLYEFIEKYGAEKRVVSTCSGNTGLLENYVHPYLGDKKLRAIKTKAVDGYYHFLKTEAKPTTNVRRSMRKHIIVSTIHDIHRVLRCAFSLTVRWECIGKNLFLNATPPEHREKERAALNPEQVLRVLEFTCRPGYYDYYMMHYAILIAVGYTLRGDEVGGLQWDRVYYDRQAMNIGRVIDRVGKKSMEELSKVEIIYTFPNLYPGAKTTTVLKQPKTEGSVRVVKSPSNVLEVLSVLKKVQSELREELEADGYMDYNLVICQANGCPIMTKHLNGRSEDILAEMNDPEIDPEETVFHSLRHTSASAELTLSNGDYNSVERAGGRANPGMLTRRYGTRSFANDRERLSQRMDDFPEGKAERETKLTDTEQALKVLTQVDPALLMEIVKSIQSADESQIY